MRGTLRKSVMAATALLIVAGTTEWQFQISGAARVLGRRLVMAEAGTAADGAVALGRRRLGLGRGVGLGIGNRLASRCCA